MWSLLEVLRFTSAAAGGEEKVKTQNYVTHTYSYATLKVKLQLPALIFYRRGGGGGTIPKSHFWLSIRLEGFWVLEEICKLPHIYAPSFNNTTGFVGKHWPFSAEL